jgi:hypothetical protein
MLMTNESTIRLLSIRTFESMAGFSYLVSSSFESDKKNEALVYFILALLFQPFFKISLVRELLNMVDANCWNIVDFKVNN